MKLLITLSYYMPNISGLTLYAKHIAEAFAESGYDVTIVTSGHMGSLPREEKIHRRLRVIRIPVSFIVGKGPIMLSYPFRIFRYVKDADVVNCHLPQFESSIVALFATLLGKRLIVTYQCDIPSNKTVGSYLVRAAVFLSHSLTLMLADTIVVLSQDYAEHSPLLSRFLKKVVPITPPVVLPQKDSSYISQFTRMIPQNTQGVIGYIGRLSEEKGIEYLLDALSLLNKRAKRPYVLLLAGPEAPIGEGGYVENLERLLRKQKYVVIRLGMIPDEAVVPFYSLLDVLVLPSVNSFEAFGLVQAEAMRVGIPVVATDLPGVRVPIQLTGMGILVPPRNAQAIAEAVGSILSRPITDASKKKAARVFSLQKTLTQYQAVFTSKPGL